MKKKLAVIMALAVFATSVFAGCGSAEKKEEPKKTESKEEKKDEYHIAIVTPTLSVSEDEYLSLIHI